MLEGYRALDLTDQKGVLCGRILADLGVDVIKVEEPGGDPCRHIEPFYKGISNSERSLFWLAFNANKKGITLNLETKGGRELFAKLVKESDFVIESFRPGYLETLSLGYSTLREINPRIIMTSITAFGQFGPYRDYKAGDLELMALGGVLFITGDPDRPPVRVSLPISYLLASADAAGATLMAHYFREVRGEGQYIDVSIQQAVTWLTMNIRQWWEMEQKIVHRCGQFRERRPGLLLRVIWPCQDGAVSFLLLGGAMGPRNNGALAQWIVEEGMADEFFKTFDWESLDYSKTSDETFARLEATITQFFLRHTKTTLYEEALKRRILLAPVNTIKDIVCNPQLVSRQYWLKLEHPELGTSLTYPGNFIKSSVSSCSPKHRAPLIGEHNDEVYEQIGVSKERLSVLKQAGVI